MKYYELDKEEQEVLRAVEDAFAAFPKTATTELEKYRSYARHTSNRSRNINIRVSERDLLKLKAKAVEMGLPYQTLIASILHQYNNKA